MLFPSHDRVGEYGTENGRPHYHALLFSVHPLVVEQLDSIWSDGFVHVGDVTADSIDYVTKYVVNRHDYKHYVEPPFALISNGIGKAHMERNKELYRYATSVRNDRGFNQSVPRYYRDKLGQPKGYSSMVKAKLRADVEKKEDEEFKKLRQSFGGELPAMKYVDERSVAGSRRILKKVKEGGRFNKIG